MPRVHVDPTIRSAPQARALSQKEIQILRALPYPEYLKTQWWYYRRNQALREASYRCAVCKSKRDLQVHHESYEHLGCEHPEDLVVVCRGCHLGYHYNETQDGIGIYTRILSQVIQDLPGAEFVDVIEEAKTRCGKAKIDIEPYRFNAAVARVNSRIKFKAPEGKRELFERREEGQPLSHAEACGLMRKCGGFAAIKHMPKEKQLSELGQDAVKAYAIYMQAVREQIKRCEEAERAALEADDASQLP